MSAGSMLRMIDMWQVLQDPRTPRTTWSISDALAVELTRYLELRKPERILEIGSGLSTVVLGAYAVRHGASVVTLEHAWKFYQRTRQALAQFGMDKQVQLRLAPLQSRQFERYGREAPWYDTWLSGIFDFVFVDGPRRTRDATASSSPSQSTSPRAGNCGSTTLVSRATPRPSICSPARRGTSCAWTTTGLTGRWTRPGSRGP